MIQLRQVSTFVYDIFHGVGFNWTRVRVTNKGLQNFGGIKLSKEDLARTESVIVRFPKGSLDPVEV